VCVYKRVGLRVNARYSVCMGNKERERVHVTRVCCSVLQCVAVCCSVLQCVENTYESACDKSRRVRRLVCIENEIESVRVCVCMCVCMGECM